MTDATAGGAVRLHTDDGGTGDATPVVLLHSLAGNAGHWRHALPHLRETRRAVALDWRGHGRSPAGDGTRGFAAAAGDVLATLDALGVARFVLVAHSAGTAVALETAAAAADRVAGLLLLDAVGDYRMVPAEELEGFLAMLEGDGYADAIGGYWSTIAGDGPARDAVLADLRATAPDTVRGFFRALTTFDPAAALSRYPGRRRLVQTPPNDGPFSLQHLAPGTPHEFVEGTGHWLHLDRPDEIARILDAFLAEVDAAGR
jgi:pimeloyl-ACP methyl ester carboxylesterase